MPCRGFENRSKRFSFRETFFCSFRSSSFFVWTALSFCDLFLVTDKKKINSPGCKTVKVFPLPPGVGHSLLRTGMGPCLASTNVFKILLYGSSRYGSFFLRESVWGNLF